MKRTNYAVRVAGALTYGDEEAVGLYLATTCELVENGFDAHDGTLIHTHYAEHFFLERRPYRYLRRDLAETAAQTFGMCVGRDKYEFEIVELEVTE